MKIIFEPQSVDMTGVCVGMFEFHLEQEETVLLAKKGTKALQELVHKAKVEVRHA